MPAATLKHFKLSPSAPSQLCCNPSFLLSQLFASPQRWEIVVYSFVLAFLFLARSISVSVPRMVLRTDKAADLRRQQVHTNTWLRAKGAWAANPSPTTGKYRYVCSSFPLHSCWKAFPLPFELSERGRGAKLTAVLLSWRGWNRLFWEVMNEDD